MQILGGKGGRRKCLMEFTWGMITGKKSLNCAQCVTMANGWKMLRALLLPGSCVHAVYGLSFC
jgi:hypothetical protein